MRNDHYAEALVTSVFTVEKTMRRVLRALIVSAGFPTAQTNVLMTKFDGLGKIKDVWQCFDPVNERLSDFVSPFTLQVIAEAQRMRNELVHGYDGWSKIRSRKKSALHTDPRVRIT